MSTKDIFGYHQENNQTNKIEARWMDQQMECKHHYCNGNKNKLTLLFTTKLFWLIIALLLSPHCHHPRCLLMLSKDDTVQQQVAVIVILIVFVILFHQKQ